MRTIVLIGESAADAVWGDSREVQLELFIYSWRSKVFGPIPLLAYLPLDRCC